MRPKGDDQPTTMDSNMDIDRLTVAILVVSTTVALRSSVDTTSPALRNELLQGDGAAAWSVEDEVVVSDDVLSIQNQVIEWTSRPSPPNLIITTGGTGFAVTDRTPEAIKPLLEKQAPGLVQAMLANSLQVTQFAMMARPVAGIRHKSVIVTLPGSPKGAVENLRAIIKTLPHACFQVCGGDSRALHAGGLAKLESDAGIRDATRSTGFPEWHNSSRHHSHLHDHQIGCHRLVTHTNQGLSNDPQLGPTRRHRESPYPMISVDEALDLINQHIPEPEVVKRKVDEAIVGSVLAASVVAQENVPAFDASIVDGYAVYANPTVRLSGTFPVAAVSHARPSEVKAIGPEEVTRITTGAPLPSGTTAVIMVENTFITTMTEDGTEELEIGIKDICVTAGDNVRHAGSDIQQGFKILECGERITSVGGEIGLLAAVGVTEVAVYKRPIVGVLSTGDEIVDFRKLGPLRRGEVRDTNRISLLSAIRERGFEAVDLGIARDNPQSLEETLRASLRRVDVLITSGGVSMGELDLLKPTIERALGGCIHFGRVAMKPGKPTTFATVPVKDDAGRRVSKAIFALPGNPASALVTFHLFVLVALHRKSGIFPAGLPRVPIVLDDSFHMDSRPEFHRARVTVEDNRHLMATSTGGQRSSMVGSLRSANALVAVPAGSGPLPRGTIAEALLMNLEGIS